MKILIIGSGGREHALAWKIRQSPLVTKVYCAPGNPGIGEIADLVPHKPQEIEGLLKFAIEQGIDLTVVGPEQPLVEGIADAFEEKGLAMFGPSKAAARIEGSKVFAKEFMKAHDIPTAEFRSFDSSRRFDAERYIDEMPVPVVIKADGLAAGKGVVVCETKEGALEALAAMMDKKIFGEAGTTVVIEEFLVGEEASVLAITDGTDFLILPPAQDHKRILDGEQGKNTGGMGAFAPAPAVDAEMLETIKRSIIRPALLGMKKDGRPFKGCLYAGLMITETGPKVVEFNCRFGDPETQVILPLLENDIVELLMGAVSGKLSGASIRLKESVAVCVVVGSGGYPGRYATGMPILGLDRAAEEPDVVIFHSGTALDKGQVVTSGGRVVGVTAFGAGQTGEATVDRAYRAVRKITFDGAYYRSDIGRKAVARLKKISRAEVE
jgi:phosphoribosylamine--glycine ligase